jgi:hypothetical protein
VWRKPCSLYRNIFIGQNFNTTPASISHLVLLVPFPSHPSRRKDYTPVFLPPRSLGNPYQWITCLAFHPQKKGMIFYLWSLISFRIWPSSQLRRRISQWKILPSSYLNECGSILGYHAPSYMTKIAGSSTNFG